MQHTRSQTCDKNMAASYLPFLIATVLHLCVRHICCKPTYLGAGLVLGEAGSEAKSEEGSLGPTYSHKQPYVRHPALPKTCYKQYTSTTAIFMAAVCRLPFV